MLILLSNFDLLIECQSKQFVVSFPGMDGMGAQMYNQMKLKAYCNASSSGCSFVFKGSTQMHHNYANDPNFIVFTEHFFNLWHNDYHIEQVTKFFSFVLYPWNFDALF